MCAYPAVEATAEINRRLLGYHRDHGFRIYDSFPLVSDDPTLIFTNATITPFKHLFLEESPPHDYALVQQCLRVGGGAGNPDIARTKENYSSVFEMFGSGCFGRTHSEATRYLIDMLVHVGISTGNIRVIVPEGSPFYGAVTSCGINPNQVYPISANGHYWRSWKFGRHGLLGSGITVVHVRPGTHVESAEDLASQPETCVEIGNLIHVFGKDNNGDVGPIPNQGFEIGMGSLRLAIIMEGKPLWELASFHEIFAATKTALESYSNQQLDRGFVRLIADRIRTISVLVLNGVRPGNKREGFVLRKMIRSCCELVWIDLQEACLMADIVRAFCNVFAPEHLTQIVETVTNEEQRFRAALQRGIRVFESGACTNPAKLMDTYGLRQQLIPVLSKSAPQRSFK